MNNNFGKTTYTECKWNAIVSPLFDMHAYARLEVYGVVNNDIHT